jgi:hypothetical protein
MELTILAMRAYVAILVGHNLKDVVKSVVMLLCECGVKCMGTGVDEHRREHKERKECMGTL